jgi:hypothetical protein
LREPLQRVQWLYFIISFLAQQLLLSCLAQQLLLSSAIVTINACNGEKLSDLNIELPDDIERNIPNWVFPTQQNLPTRHQSRPDDVLVMPRGKRQALGSQTDSH